MVLPAALTAFALLLGYTSAADPPADYPGDETPYRVIPTGTVDPDNFLGTYLYGYNECNKIFGSGAKGKIDDAYYDAWVITNTAGVASDIDWNNAAALEFLGAPGLNKGKQGQIQAVLANVATMIYSYKNPFQHYIKVRCDDPRKKCQKRPDQDRCLPKKPDPGEAPKPKPTPLAYSMNSDPDSKGVPMINFCEGFFNRHSLADAITYGKALASPNHLKLAMFDNRAQTFLHEMLHLDLAADSSASDTPNPRVDDLTIDFKTGKKDEFGQDEIITTKAYGTLATKILARYQGTGYHVQRNADNLAYYALAKYVMTKNGNIYPHLPVVTYKLSGPPYPGTLAMFAEEDGNFYMNTTVDDLSAWETTPGNDYPGCSDNENPSAGSSTLTIDGFIPDSAYPDEYNSQKKKWIEDIRGTDDGEDGSGGAGGDQGQQVAIASYINPLGDPAAWSRLLAYDSGKVSVLVANVLNGPDYVVDKDWQSVIEQAAGQGKKILGYVRTGYLGVSQQQFTTRLGSRNLADWASQIEQDIDKWYELYGSSLGGIFFDEGWPECGPNNIYADLYAYIDDYMKRKHPGAYTVLNPGSPIAKCFEDTMDTLLTFENSYETYQNSFVANDWTPKDPRKIWHIIYQVPQAEIATVAALASSRHVGLIEITDDVPPNPYDNLPSDAYMQAVIAAVDGGSPPIKDPAEVTSSYVAGLPSDVAVSSSDYSSVTLTWSSVANALGYAVYKDGKQVLELPASLTRATIGMIDPGTSGITFEVRTVLSSGSGSGSARTITASTKALPKDGSIANVGFTQSGDTVTYTADVLVPYAFVRLFIGKDQPDIGNAHGWPIQAPSTVTGWAQHEIVNYLVEGNDFYSGLYKYAGTWYETSSANAEWSWSSIGEAKQTQDGYTYTWVVPLGGTDAVAKEYVVQGQGYAPIKNVFKGSLRKIGTPF
ncbi:Spherulation-specific family 4-domain-containing protein [Aspergillus carlsbadensis]|nr:Spherulation-specific family 4-domain-containing protein [Aspergillus carlsbadensis]